MSVAQEAKRAVERIVKEHEGAWGGLLLQTGWLESVIESACQRAVNASRSNEWNTTFPTGDTGKSTTMCFLRTVLNRMTGRRA